MDWLLRVIGVLILLVAAQDVFVTVLFPASGHGLVRRPAARLTWALFRLLTRRIHGQRRRDVLAYGGPVQVTVTLATWTVLLVTGWALIFKPALGTGIQAASGPTDTSWPAAFYYSGYALTTLGTGDAAELLAGLAEAEDLAEARDFFTSLTRFVLTMHESHRFYPVLRYFHYRYPYYSLPRILLLALDSATLTRTALDKNCYRALIRSITAEGLVEASLQLVAELVPGASAHPPAEQTAAVWRARYERAVIRLGEAGGRVNDDLVAGADEYVRLRGQWDAQLRALAAVLLYEWDVIEPHLPRVST